MKTAPFIAPSSTPPSAKSAGPATPPRRIIAIAKHPAKGTGQLAQAELGLDYYVARWYDPVLGHFTQADTIVPEPGQASSYDRYAYVLNNPIKYSDPTGHRDSGKCGPGEDCDRKPRFPYKSRETNIENEIKVRSASKYGVNSVTLLSSIIRNSPPTSYYSIENSYYSPYGPFDSSQFKFNMDFAEKIALPTLSAIDIATILDKGYKITSSGEFIITKGTLPLGYIESLVAGFRQGYEDYFRNDISPIQKFFRIGSRSAEAYAGDSLSTLAGGFMATSFAESGPIGIGVGYIIGSVGVSYLSDWAFDDFLNPWIFPNLGLGEK